MSLFERHGPEAGTRTVVDDMKLCRSRRHRTALLAVPATEPVG